MRSLGCYAMIVALAKFIFLRTADIEKMSSLCENRANTGALLTSSKALPGVTEPSGFEENAIAIPADTSTPTTTPTPSPPILLQSGSADVPLAAVAQSSGTTTLQDGQYQPTQDTGADNRESKDLSLQNREWLQERLSEAVRELDYFVEIYYLGAPIVQSRAAM